MDNDRKLVVTRLSDIRPKPWPYGPCHVRDGALMCSMCGMLADSIHLLPGACPVERIEAACSSCDPGGWWIDIRRLQTRTGEVLAHLATKRRAEGSEQAVTALFRWLGHAGAMAVFEGGSGR